jgi:hypothetical protein
MVTRTFTALILTSTFAFACSSKDPMRGEIVSPMNEVPEPPIENPPLTPPTEPPVVPPVNPPETPDAGPCPNGCDEHSVGQDGEPFDPDTNPSDGVELDPDGALVVAHGATVGASYIWIADTQGTPPSISKVDTRTEEIVARYAVGSMDPSRTSVSLGGDAYVASRAGMGVTKISGRGADCPDTNGDGMITTSSGPGDVLPFGEDDCMLWYRQFDQEIRAVAAQDIAGTTEIMDQPDGPPIVTTTPDEHYVWIGLSTVSDMTGGNPTAMKLDGETGDTLISTPMPRGAYGFALDGRGILWLTGGAYWGGQLGFIDTSKCIDDATCNVAPCQVTCSTTSCPATCDGAVKGDIMLQPTDAYGITVDCKQRVWLGSQIKRYDPLAPANQRLALTSSNELVAGIAADANGWVWGASSSIQRVNADDLTQSTTVMMPEGSQGVAIDIDGKIWGIGGGQTVRTIMPGAGLMDAVVAPAAITGFLSPYSYSDMTGVQQRLAATDEPGTYQQVFEGCAEGPTTWEEFSFDAETPDGTRVVFHARAADTIEELEDASWLPLAGAPSMTTDVQLTPVLGIGSTPQGKYVEILLELYMDPAVSDKCASSEAKSPKVKGIGLTMACKPPDPGGPD